jgi:hypothetical protein
VEAAGESAQFMLSAVFFFVSLKQVAIHLEGEGDGTVTGAEYV